MTDEKQPAKNVLGGALTTCSRSPMTGWFRDGCCNTDASDHGLHLVCVRMTAEFLAFSKRVGNDLSSPSPGSGFSGLKPGDRWCLCAQRWKEALDAGVAPLVYLASTHEKMLELVSIDVLRKHAAEMIGTIAD